MGDLNMKDVSYQINRINSGKKEYFQLDRIEVHGGCKITAEKIVAGTELECHQKYVEILKTVKN